MQKIKEAFNFMKDWRSVMLLVALATLAWSCIYINDAFKAFEETLVREKAWEKQQDVNLLCDLIDSMSETDETADYEAILNYAVQYVEKNYTSTFAQLYDAELVPLFDLNEGVGGGKKHNPLDYPEFVEAVNNNESGSLIYWYETEQAGGRDIYMYYKWLTVGGERYLIATGVSKYTIRETVNMGLVNATFAIIIIASIFIVGTVFMLCQMGSVYIKRKGAETWREKTSS